MARSVLGYGEYYYLGQRISIAIQRGNVAGYL